MKLIFTFLLLCLTGFAQQTVTDYDGNIYETVTIGDQVWLKENLKSLHYCNGTPIPEVVAYNNEDSLSAIYGLLYTWDAAMNGSDIPAAQGVCPCDWHVPTDEEWTILEDYLGGPSVAGGKMKETGTDHWLSPNTGATNSSGFTGLPAGEFDGYFVPNKFWLLNIAAVFWTSSQTNQLQAMERYLSHDDAVCGSLAWYKVMKYSIRCIKNSPSEVERESNPIREYELLQNYPNPFNPTTKINFAIPSLGAYRNTSVLLKVYDVLGNEVATVVNKEMQPGNYEVEFDAAGLTSGIYYYQLLSDDFIETKKMILLK
jgi:uncharacterized protein (TIGR02145 family)